MFNKRKRIPGYVFIVAFLALVISAAIAAAEETTTDGFVVRSIKRRPSNKWNS